eukprot:6794125-Prymnesium_polylepis.1
MPHVVKERNMARPSLRDSASSPLSGTGSASPSVIMMLRKKVLYLAIRVITSLASACDMPRLSNSAII